MAEQAKNELSGLRAEYKAIVGKNPSPRLDADGLRVKIAELKMAPPAVPAVDGADKPADAAEPAPEAPHGTAFMRHTDPDASASYRGVEIVPNKKGLCLVPLGAVDELVAHGFELVGAGPAE